MKVSWLVPASALALSVAATLVVRRLALSRGLVSTPRADRWGERPTALLGGAAIVVATLVPLVVVGPWPRGAVVLVAGALALAGVGLADDLVDLPPWSRLVAQAAAALLLVAAGDRVRWTGWPALDVVLTLLWVVGITNAVNLVDNMDGLAGGVVLIAAALMAAWLHAEGQDVRARIATSVAAATLGFLAFNFRPASIYMGDCGSMFLGFLVAGLPLFGEAAPGGVAAPLVPALLLIVPILDTALVIVARRRASRSIFQGGRDHCSHRLVASGLSEREAVLLLYLVAVSAGAAALGVVVGAPLALVAVPGITMLAVATRLVRGAAGAPE